ncbi:MAG: TolC family protein [Desulfobacterales bacterium]|nr:TolC family protein [Desulfobacterales bacterium]
MLFLQVGCQTPSHYRLEADGVAKTIVQEKQKQALGKTEAFNIERPSDILRRRLLIQQNLPHAGEASLGTDKLTPIEHWPEKGYPKATLSPDQIRSLEPGKPLKLSLMEALQIGARNSFEYQTRKEDIFRAALDLDLERNEFRNTFRGLIDSLISANLQGEDTVTGTETIGSVDWSRKLKSGVEFTAALAIDLVKLWTQDRSSSLGLLLDVTIAIPLLRGSGKHIVTEPLTQAERNVIYAIWEFERFKKTFAVSVAGDYLGVLRRFNEVENAAENYRNLIASTRRSRQLANAGRITEIQVDQSLQNELRARNRWVSAQELYKSHLDVFKTSIGLPPDAEIELDKSELDRLVGRASKLMPDIAHEGALNARGEIPPADEPIELIQPSREDVGPLEIDAPLAIRLGLENRLDLRVSLGQVYDAQRKCVVLADQLGAELTLFGSAALGESRSIATAELDNAKLRADKGIYSALLTIDLPFERTAEQNAYRNGLISLERAVRDVQELEDGIKLAIRDKLRDMVEARESLKIQARAVNVAEKRVKSTSLFYEAGRAQVRDVLEAQEALINTKNALTSAVVDYRIAELEFQRDTGLLQIDERGLWQEYAPEKGGLENVGEK